MGGSGSGRSGWKWKTRDMLRLDILHIKKLGILHPGNIGGLNWSCGASIGFTVFEHSVQLNFRVRLRNGSWEDVLQTISTEWTPCRFGGKRPWFRCPHCCRHCYVLYGHRIFLCRKCHDLAYASQCETQQDRMFRRANKCRERLGGAPGMIRIEKPPRMWWQTYMRLVREMEAFSARGIGPAMHRISAQLERLKARSAGRRRAR